VTVAPVGTVEEAGEPGTTRRLWYRAPASTWLEALPLGDGRLGAMVWGGRTVERVSLNEETFWSPAPKVPAVGKRVPLVEEVRTLVAARDFVGAEELADRCLVGPPRRLQSFQPLGDLVVEGLGLPREGGCYSRELRLDEAVARTLWGEGEHLAEREVFVSRADGVVVVHHAGPPGRGVGLRARFEGAFPVHAASVADGAVALYSGRWLEGARSPQDGPGLGDREPSTAEGMGFAVAIRAMGPAVTASVVEGALEVSSLGMVTLLVDAQTSFDGRDPAAACLRRLELAVQRNYEDLRQRHVSAHWERYGRADLSLEAKDLADDDRPTDERLVRANDGAVDPGLDALFFAYGRYLLLSSSGSLPSNLQGLWNREREPAWGSKWTLNINLEMNYWPAEVANLAEAHGCLASFVDSLRAPGRATATELYGCAGFVAHHNTDLWRSTGVVDGARWGLWAMGAAWLCRHLMEHYRFSADPVDLRSAYPVLVDAARFVADFLVEDDEGRLVTSPSMSPENAYLDDEGRPVVLCAGPTIDTWLAGELLGSTADAADELGVDAALATELRSLAARLPTPRVGRHGQLQEWLEDVEEAEPGHRHMAHLYGLYPGDAITPQRTPALARGAKVSIDRRRAANGARPLPGWSLAWMIALHARLGDAEAAYDNLHELLAQATAPNLFGLHPPGVFQVDGNLGATAGIAELLLQSHAGRVAFLPALPAAWPSGSFRGLRARGGLEADLAWSEGRAITGVLRSRCAGAWEVEAPAGQRIVSCEPVGSARLAPTAGQPSTSTVSVALEGPGTLRLEFG